MCMQVGGRGERRSEEAWGGGGVGALTRSKVSVTMVPSNLIYEHAVASKHFSLCLRVVQAFCSC